MAEVRNLAPIDEMVRYLAVFERCLRFIQNAGVRRNRSEMLLGGYLADALHNVPALLCSFDTDDWNQGDRFRTSLRRAPEIARNHNAPADMIRACRALLKPVAHPGELGLDADLAGLDLAPPEKLSSYLDLLYRACLSFRTMRNFGFPPPPREFGRDFWCTSDENWSPEGDTRGVDFGVLASIYLPIPAALVSWCLFGEKEYWEEVERTWTAHFGAEHWEKHGQSQKQLLLPAL